MMLNRSLLTLASPGGDRAKLSTLVFHRVLPERDELLPDEIDVAQFENICSWVKDWFNVLPMREAIDRLYRGGLPPRSLAISFDDGYADNESIAAPILSKHRLPATFFVASAYLDGGCMWNDGIIHAVRRCELSVLDLRGLGVGVSQVALDSVTSRRAALSHLISQLKYRKPEVRQALVTQVANRAQVTLPTNLMMTSVQLKRLHAQGFDIGAHTATHPILARLDRATARHEVESGRDRLSDILKRPIALFAYPNGKPDVDYTQQTVRLVKDAGFEAAASTSWGIATRHSDRFQLPRFTPWDRSRLRFGARMARNCLSREVRASETS